MKRALVWILSAALAFAPAAASAQAGPPIAVTPPNLGSNSGSSGTFRDFANDFHGVCDGATDNQAAFTAASTWIATTPNNPIVLIGPCAAGWATSTTVTLGNGRELSTTLSGTVAGGVTSLPLTSTTGIQSGDALAIQLNSGVQRVAVTAPPSGGNVTISPALSGAANSGNVVYAGNNSTYHGGGFVGYGSGATNAEVGAGINISRIKYIGAAAPTTTLTVTAAAGATSITVASAADVAISGVLAITLDSGAVWLDTAAQSPAGNVVQLSSGLPTQATSGNTVTIANNPVAKISGPMVAPQFSGILLDANSLAAIGFEGAHIINGKIVGPRGVVTKGYTVVGVYLHPQQAYLSSVVGAQETDYEIYALQPANTHTIGCWFKGSPNVAGQKVAFSRNHFNGGTCTQGGADVTAASIREEAADNNTWIKANVAGSGTGAGLYRQPTPGILLFGADNAFFNPALGSNGVVDGTAAGGSLGKDWIDGYPVSDSQPVPAGAESGFTAAGLPFGITGVFPTGALTTYTPTLSCAVGSLGSGNTALGRYAQVVGTKIIFLEIQVTLGASGAGTCATAILATLPTAAANAQIQILTGRDNGVGSAIVATIAAGASTARMTTYNNGCPCGNNGIPTLSGFYEVP